MARKENPIEEEVKHWADLYVELVEEFVKEYAPYKPWWDVELSQDEMLARYEEVRPKIMPWLATAAVHMGMKDFGELLKRLDEIWMSPLATDTIPLQVQVAVPRELLELVQSNPIDAAKHIRKMETLWARHTAAKEAIAEADAAVKGPIINTKKSEPGQVPAYPGQLPEGNVTG